jgi:BMFP domain-containing protein YqiC
MATPVRVLDDLAKVANGAVSTVVGMKHEVDQLIRQRLEKLLTSADLVPREEFEAVQAMAAEARAEQDRLEARVAALEARIGAAKPAAKKAAVKKAAARKTPKKTAPKKTAAKRARGKTAS